MRRALLSAIATAACLAPAGPAAAEVQFLRQFGGEKGKEPGQFALPDGVGVDNAGNVWVADSQNNRIQRFSPEGRVLPFPAFAKRGWSQAPGRFKLPYDVDADALGNLFVADTQNHRIQKFTPEGRFVRMWGRNGGDGTPGVGPGEMDQPRGLAVDPSGNVWVADHENARVLKFDNDGRLLLTLGKNGGDGSYGEGVGEFNSPRGICTDAAGTVYVADDVNHRIVKLANDDGRFLAIFGKPGGPASGFGTGPGEFKLPYGCAVDDRNHLWVADTNNNRVVELTTDGMFIRNWGVNGGDGTGGAGPGEFEEPYNAGSDCAGNVYISDEHNHRVQVFGEPAKRRPVCPPGLTISGGAAQLGKRRIVVDARCDRDCRAVARATMRD
ncbi:MAG: SMP-30/gluconolactonase/LRE family protein, partial [Actinomycetota bacterium]|nr:SMP-30/gluconolactonase/LRE family protein [Actinomycetota bacterium]